MGEAAGKFGQKTDFVQRFLDFILPVMLVLVQVIVNQTFGDDVVHLGPLVQGGHGILENHLHGADDFFIHFFADLSADPLTTEEDFTVCNGVNPDDGPADGGFAAAGFTDQGEGFSLIDLKVDMIHGHELFASGTEGHLEILNLHQGFAVRIQVRMIRIRISAVVILGLGKTLDGLGLLHFGRPGILQPGFDHMGGCHLIHGRLFQEVNVQRLFVPRREGVTLDLVEQVGRRTVNGGKLFSLDAQLGKR